MILVPWEYLRFFFPFLKTIDIPKVIKKITTFGLETNIVVKNKENFLEFIIPHNRYDLFSWLGIVREIGILMNYEIVFSHLLKQKRKGTERIELKVNSDRCSFFLCILLKNIKSKDIIFPIRNWLIANKIEPVNNIIDLTNLLTLETGYLINIFDYDNYLLVKKNDKKKILLEEINNKEIENKIDRKNIIISVNKKNIISLKDREQEKKIEISQTSKNILLISFSLSENVNKDNNQYKNNLSFSKSLILNSYVITKLKKEKKISIEYYFFEKKKKRKKIIINGKDLENKIGCFFSSNVLENILKRLKFDYKKTENGYIIYPPSFRLDINNAEDIYEELLKIYNFNKVKSLLPIWNSNIRDNNVLSILKKERQIRNFLSNSGWQEIITYSLIPENDKKELSYYLISEKSKNHKLYRRTLVDSHIRTVNYNLSYGNEDLLFFEISSVFFPNSKKEICQEKILTLSSVGKIFSQKFHKLVEKIDFFWLKGTLENVFCLLSIKDINFHSISLSKKKCWKKIEIILNKKIIGYIGFVENKEKKNNIFISEISLTKIFEYIYYDTREKKNDIFLSKFPFSKKDVSFLLHENSDYDKIIEEIKEMKITYLKEIIVFDIYQNEKLKKERKKTIGFRFFFQSLNKTLEKKEIKEILEKIIEKITKKFQAEIN